MKFRIWLFLFLFLLFFPLFSSSAFGQVVINEFLPNPSSGDDWIELYNTSDAEVDISNWWVEDSTSKMKTFDSGTNVSAKGYFHFFVGKRLNESNDTIKLASQDGQEKDNASYSSNPGTDVSIGRCPDGSGGFLSLSSATPGSANNCPTATPTPTLTPTPIPSPTSGGSLTNTPTPTQAKGIYKINEVKNEDDDILSNVKIYVDGGYVHHYAPETLEFCSGCYCYNKDSEQVSCGFGEHTIRLEKSGYDNWSQTKTINAGDSFEVDPVMYVSSSSSPTSTPTPTPTPKPNTPTPTPTPTAKLSPTPTSNPEVLGHEATEGGLFLLDEATPTASVLGEESRQPRDFVPFVFIAVGAILIGGALVPFLPKEKLKGVREKIGGIIKPTEL